MSKRLQQVRGLNRRYTREFRQEALRLVTEGKLSVAEAARQLGIRDGILLTWKKRAEAGNSLSSDGQDTSAVEMERFSTSRREFSAANGAGNFKRSDGLLREGVEKRHLFIQRQRSIRPVATLCRLVEVPRSVYYAWQGRPVSPRKLREIELTGRIRGIHGEKYKDAYGSPRVHCELLKQGWSCNPKTVARCIKKAGIREIRPCKYRVCATDSKHPHPLAPNVVDRQFTPAHKNQTWTADVTYIRTAEGGLFLAIVLDLYSRKVVGWSMSAKNDSRLVVDAHEMALQSERPGAKLVVHSDRGVQYASEHYQRLLTERKITCSMIRTENCWDNAPTESFFATLKKERVYHQQYLTRDAARASLFEYMETFYNPIRRHSTLNFLSPCQLESFNHTLNLTLRFNQY